MEPHGYSYSSARLDATFAALADPTRRAILARLAKGEASVTDLAEPFAMSQPAISKHLKVLERAGLISRGRDAQRRPRRLEARALGDASQWLENYRRFWEAQFRRWTRFCTKCKVAEHGSERNARSRSKKQVPFDKLRAGSHRVFSPARNDNRTESVTIKGDNNEKQ
jgi:DNA-binding transcriptional ArsR family regulator